MKPIVTIGLLAVGLLAVPGLALTHHSNAVIDKDRLLTVPGEVTKFSFALPHVAIYWTGEDETGETVEWYASSATPRTYARLGWNNKTFTAGQKILVQGMPVRDGRPVMQFAALYRCGSGESIPVESDILNEDRTRVMVLPLSPDRVNALCDEGKLVEGEID